MNAYIIYIVETAIALGVFYSIYRLALRRQTFFGINRAVLISAIFLSFVLPYATRWMPRPVTEKAITTAFTSPVPKVNSPSVTPNARPSTLNVQPATSTSNPLPAVIGWSLLSVSLLLCAYRLMAELRLFVVVKRSRRRRLCCGVYWIEIPEGRNPFSWRNYVFASAADTQNEHILTHELCHIRKMHSEERLLTDLILSLQWFSPFAWMLRRELECQQEYEADRAAVGRTEDATPYLSTLLARATSHIAANPAACGLRRGTLKERFKMMQTSPSHLRSLWRTLLFVPAIGLVGFVLACKEGKIATEQTVRGSIEMTFPADLRGSITLSRTEYDAQTNTYADKTLDSARIVNGKYRYKYALSEPQGYTMTFYPEGGGKRNFVVMLNPYYNKVKDKRTITRGIGWIVLDEGAKRIDVTRANGELEGTYADIESSPAMKLEFKMRSGAAFGQVFTTNTSDRIINFDLIRENAHNPWLLNKLCDYAVAYTPETLEKIISLIDPALMQTSQGLRLQRDLDYVKEKSKN